VNQVFGFRARWRWKWRAKCARRNPFVNQVFGFTRGRRHWSHDAAQSQSLRESGLWFPAYQGSDNEPDGAVSQSLRESGLWFPSSTRHAMVLCALCRNPFVNQVFGFRRGDRGLRPRHGRNPFVNQVFGFGASPAGVTPSATVAIPS